MGLPRPARWSSQLARPPRAVSAPPAQSPAAEPRTRAPPATAKPRTARTEPVQPATVCPMSWSPCVLMTAPVV
ncbi:hypothetical protein VM95_35265 [Streptomyces rubellomurinus]|uniref:Uncharacterized protein n=1 Tax=Streptomyces rubellomurinus (strain ATCC 31215) TaxID=359131 RepID=A0A0F2T4M1_STRR3|nr:hypothetical protein VM95_35265 [Streptomyces rubellomurinus]